MQMLALAEICLADIDPAAIAEIPDLDRLHEVRLTAGAPASLDPPP